jgi:hypothetical protein
MANSNDISDVKAPSAIGSPKTLPIRGEKRILPITVNPDSLSNTFEQEWSKSGLKSPQDKGYAPTGRTQLVQYDDFYVAAAMKPYVDYVTVRILNRGQDANGNPDPTTSASYRFLINPSQVQVSRSTLDAQAFARSGWQFGVWGEDSVSITLDGKTAGQYWAFGITDKYQPFSESYRNLEQLQVVFENNGYWFEGEQAAGEGPLATDFARRRIKMHQDVELTVGNFIWYGMFEQLEISQNADEPFLMSFNLQFIAWKERFRSSSPYGNQILNSTQRGNAYGAYSATQTTPSNVSPTTAIPPQLSDAVGLAPPANPNVNSSTPSVTTANSAPSLPTAQAPAYDYTPMTVPGTTGSPLAPGVSLLTGVPV